MVRECCSRTGGSPPADCTVVELMSNQTSRGDASKHSSVVRELVVDGARWSVRESTTAYDRRTRAGLVFESEAVMRRVRNYPSNWAELSDEQLFLVSWNP
jgi:hypothetical protein